MSRVPTQAEFQDRLAREMQRRGWTQQVLADRAGISQQLISRYLTGGWPKAPMLAALASALDCSVDYLLTGKDRVATPRRDADPTGALLGAQAVRPKAPAARRGRRAG